MFVEPNGNVGKAEHNIEQDGRDLRMSDLRDFRQRI